jgi:hypothetical protein
MTCIAIIGKPRTGKTLFLTAVAYYDFKNGRTIYSNYTLSFDHKPYDINDLLSISTMEMEISPKTVVMQEASKWFDARRSGRNENVLLSSFTGQSGKREIDIYYDDQFLTRIDRGLRDITDYSFMSDCTYDPFTKKPLMFSYEMYYGYFIYPMNRTIRFPVHYMQRFFEMYNTRDPTRPLIKNEIVD